MGDRLDDEFHVFELVLVKEATIESPHRLTFVTYIVRVGRIVVTIVLQWPSELDQEDEMSDPYPMARSISLVVEEWARMS
jgi:hypothetical protein